jgi:dienelactone hydrolase
MIFSTLMLLSAVAIQFTPEELTVLRDADVQAPPAEMVPKYLHALAMGAIAKRNEAFEKIKTREDAEAYQETLRASMITALGGFPAKTPLNPKVVGEGTRPGFKFQRIIFESQPGFHVTATLYLPEAKGPFPVVLLPCGHYPVAKADEEMQRVAIFLVRNNIAAFIYDPIGQGERAQILNDDGTQKFGSTIEHIMVGVGSILVGTNTATYRIWDGIRAIDYLETRPEIDITKLGCTGHSGGGTLTSYLMAIDPRIRVAVPNCYTTSSERLLNTIGPQDAEQNIYGQLAIGLTIGDYSLLHAPNPTLINCATQDFFDISGTWTVFREAKRLYGIFGVPEQIDIAETNAQHAYSPPLRQAMVRFMVRHLTGKIDAISEPNIEPIPIEELLCTPDKQVLTLEGARSVNDINSAADVELAKMRKTAWSSGDHAKTFDTVRSLANIRRVDDLPKPEYEARGEVSIESGKLLKGVIRSEPGILVPVLTFVPQTQNGKACLFVHGDGKLAAASDSRIAALQKEGWTVVCPDLRGLGETASVCKLAKPYDEFFGADWQDFYVAYLLKKSYVGMRAEDVIQCIRALPGITGVPNGSIRVIATGVAYIPALHAAALERQLIVEFELDSTRLAWSDVVKEKVTHDQLINTVNGALRVYDLTDLEQSIRSK